MNAFIETIQRTYLFERIIGLLVYVVVLIIICSKLRSLENSTRLKRTLIVYTGILVLMAFFFVPDSSKDLTRILNSTSYWVNLPFKTFVKNELSTTSTPLGSIYVYLCRQLGNNGFLPAITALVFYSNTFSIVKTIYEKRTDTSNSIAIALFIFMSAGSFLEVISDIKNFMAFSIIARCIIDEKIKDRSILWSLPWYVVSCLIHLSCTPVVLIRLVLYVFYEDNNKGIKKHIYILSLALFGLIALAFFREILDSATSKAMGYIQGNMYSYGWEYCIGAFQWILYAWVLKRYKRSKDKSTGLDALARICRVLMFFEIALAFEYNIFHRFILMNSFLMIPIITRTITEHENRGNYFFGKNLKTLSYFLLFLVCARGNLCGYKFFVF